MYKHIEKCCSGGCYNRIRITRDELFDTEKRKEIAEKSGWDLDFRINKLYESDAQGYILISLFCPIHKDDKWGQSTYEFTNPVATSVGGRSKEWMI